MRQGVDNGLLTWLDVLKLTIPVVTAFAAIWAKSAYDHRKERKLLQETLLRSFDRGPLSGAGCIGLLHDMVLDVKSDESSVVHLAVPRLVAQTCERLALLDSERAHLYADHLGILAHLEQAVADLQRLHAAYLTATSEPSRRLKNAIASAAQEAMSPFVALERSSLAIAESLALSGTVKPTSESIERARTALQDAEKAQHEKDLTLQSNRPNREDS